MVESSQSGTNETDEELQFWVDNTNVLTDTIEERRAWLLSEAAYIKGLIHRATRVPVSLDAKVLQIGAGPVDVIDAWGTGERHAIDPLATEYKRMWPELRDSQVVYLEGQGERLPYPDDSFDVIIIRNALDHCKNPLQVVREAFRCLRGGGALYVWVYQYTRRGSLGYRFINTVTRAFEREPWAFTFGRITELLENGGFVPVLPATERRPRHQDNPQDASRRAHLEHWARQSVKTIINFNHSRAFSCVALPRKEGYKDWSLV